MNVVIFSIVLILAGLAMCWFTRELRKAEVLWTIVYWAGIGLVVVGLILLLFPIFAWIHAQVVAMLGSGR